MQRQCKICNRSLTKKQKMYCSKSCGAKGTQSWKVRQKEYKDYNCIVCESIHHRKNMSFCSEACKNALEISKMKLAFTKSYASTNTNGMLKRYLIKLGIAKDECLICSISEWNGKEITLQLDHIDGNCKNNSLNNLRIICPNCHSQTETYAGKNRMRYLDKKQYKRN